MLEMRVVDCTVTFCCFPRLRWVVVWEKSLLEWTGWFKYADGDGFHSRVR
jgi:hypothetical protein